MEEHMPQDPTNVDAEVGVREEFDVIGVQIGMRRLALRPSSFKAVTTRIGDINIHAFRAELVDPGVNEDDPPKIMHVMIPADKVELLIIEPKEVDSTEAEILSRREEEDEAIEDPEPEEIEEDSVDEHDGANREGALNDQTSLVSGAAPDPA